MERVWKRVGALNSGSKKQPPENENISKPSGNTKRKTSCYRVVNKTTTMVSQKTSSIVEPHDKLRDLLWCDLVNMDDWQQLPIADDSIGEDDQQLEKKPSVRRRIRRSKGFNFHIDTHIMEFNPRALTRRLCKGSKKRDNELYRSNSFKFEKFERPTDEGAVQTQVVEVCDDYCLPVDFVNKRAHSFGAGLANWSTPSPSGEHVQVFEAYSDPRDSKAYLEPGAEPCTKVYTSPDREYCRPCSPTSQEQQEAGAAAAVGEGYEQIDTHRSPYYYGDIRGDGAHRRHQRRVRQSISLDCPREARPKHHHRPPSGLPKRNTVTGDSGWCYDADIESPVSERAPVLFKVERGCVPDGGAAAMPCDALVVAVNVGGRECSRRNHLVSCPHTEEDQSGDADPSEDMSARQRHVYETAFDSRVQRSDDELDEIDRVSNHPVLRMFNRARGLTPRLTRKDSSEKIVKSKESRKKENPVDEEEASCSQTRPISAIPGRLAMELGALRLTNTPPPVSGNAPSPPPLRGCYAPSPPSTAPLPAKFHNNVPMNSIQSAPNLPAGSPARLKDLRLPVKSLRGRGDESRKVREFKGRPNSVVMQVSGGATSVGVSQRPKYSSTESMATSSSSMSSLESLRSSTSEGNRSSSSSGSRRSDSLSSHSSDSGGDIRRIVPVTRCAPLGLLSNKLHILSPISDKSQEPVSETSDNNRNNNSQRASPEDAPSGGVQASPTVADSELPWDAPKLRRRQLQNKNLINLQLGGAGEVETLQGSDSGISIESQGRHLADLPFDMPKLRRRLAAAASSSSGGPRDTSSSATSVASSSRPEEFLQDLPFDMPKLRRRQLRPASAFEPLSSSSSHSGQRDTDSNPTDSGPSGPPVRPPNLTLDLGGQAGPSSSRPSLPTRPGGLSLNLGCSALTVQGEPVDLRLPLERQGWYHGAISRVEAEAELRLQKEGSYLVRNSESSRHDYSLSLKSARGFMHMRIQQDPKSGHYILGQFSKPFTSIPEMVHFYSINRLPIRGAEHMCLLHPVIEQLL